MRLCREAITGSLLLLRPVVPRDGVAYRPDGGVFIADWSDTGECHDHDGVHRTSGRIYKLTYGKPKAVAALDLSSEPSDQLVSMHNRPNAWWPRMARRVLTDRYHQLSSESDRRELQQRVHLAFSESPSVTTRLRLLETLNEIDGATEELLLALLGDKDEHMRVAGLRFLVDRRTADEPSPPSKILAALQAMPKGMHRDW